VISQDPLEPFRRVIEGPRPPRDSLRDRAASWLGLVTRWVSVAVLGAAVGGTWLWTYGPNVQTMIGIDEHAAPATAVVRDTDPGNHNSVTYTFSVAGRTYEGGWALDVDVATLSPGQRVDIHYDTENPAHSCICSSPHRDRVSEQYGALGLGVFGGAFVAVVGTYLGLKWLSVVLGRDLPLGPRARRAGSQ
jgi:hypothetical protein